jgi:U4/U6.U5 tri-snRNP-associated protein 3
MLVCRSRSNAFQDGGREARDRPRERSRDRRDTRSRSPRRERERGVKRDVEPEKTKILKPEEEFTKSRTATPPVSFKVSTAGQDHDRMDVDVETGQSKNKGKKGKVEQEPEDDEDIVVDDDGLAAMQAMMGFGGFGTTHQQKVAGNDIYAVRKEKKTEYRQYMNRVGGFNRPLSPTRE